MSVRRTSTMASETVRVNGKDVPLTINDAAGLISSLGYDLQKVAVELNGTICPRASLGSTVLKDGDSLEVVSFVGGG